MKIKQGCNF